MKTVKVKLFQYSELSEKAKEKARQWYLEADTFDFQWDCHVEDAKNIGLKLTEWDHYRGTIKGELTLDLTQVLANIVKDHGPECATTITAKEYQAKYSKLSEEQIINGEDEEIREDFLRAILEDYRVMIDKDYEYSQSEEAIAETMEENEYDFTEAGKRF